MFTPIVRSVEDLAADAFDKSEHLRMLSMMNTPSNYEKRKAVFIELAKARVAAEEANQTLENAIKSRKA